jgi:Lar family restriction alleviation protein
VADEIKTCPFCGSDDLEPSFHQTEHELLVCISCSACDAEGPPAIVRAENRAKAMEQANDAWNNRK